MLPQLVDTNNSSTNLPPTQSQNQSLKLMSIPIPIRNQPYSTNVRRLHPSLTNRLVDRAHPLANRNRRSTVHHPHPTLITTKTLCLSRSHHQCPRPSERSKLAKRTTTVRLPPFSHLHQSQSHLLRRPLDPAHPLDTTVQVPNRVGQEGQEVVESRLIKNCALLPLPLTLLSDMKKKKKPRIPTATTTTSLSVSEQETNVVVFYLAEGALASLCFEE